METDLLQKLGNKKIILFYPDMPFFIYEITD